MQAYILNNDWKFIPVLKDGSGQTNFFGFTFVYEDTISLGDRLCHSLTDAIYNEINRMTEVINSSKLSRKELWREYAYIDKLIHSFGQDLAVLDLEIESDIPVHLKFSGILDNIAKKVSDTNAAKKQSLKAVAARAVISRVPYDAGSLSEDVRGLIEDKSEWKHRISYKGMPILAVRYHFTTFRSETAERNASIRLTGKIVVSNEFAGEKYPEPHFSDSRNHRCEILLKFDDGTIEIYRALNGLYGSVLWEDDKEAQLKRYIETSNFDFSMVM